MIPKFPEFKNLELTDQHMIRAYTSKFDPYSDFDFASLWSWDIRGKFRISELNKNLVVILTDHFTDDEFYSFLGNHEVNKTVKQLFAFPISNNPSETIRLVPEVSLQDMDFTKHIIEIDLNNYDYVYDTEEQAKLEGAKFSTKRKMANKFIRNYPNCKVQNLDLSSQSNQELILDLSQKWSKKKSDIDEGIDSYRELAAIKRFLDAQFAEVLCVSLFIDEKLIAYEIFTLLKEQKFAISHFSKIDTSFVGSYEYLSCQYSKWLNDNGIKYLNAEEDLGLPGLRFSKNSFKPISFLRKYSIIEI